MQGNVVIVLSTYNNSDLIEKSLLSYLTQSEINLQVVVADDGSTDQTRVIIEKLRTMYSNLHTIYLEHGERGIARKMAIEEAKKLNPEFIVIMDSDMQMVQNLIKDCLAYFHNHADVGALVIPEKAYSESKNLMTKVKVFERTVINNAGHSLGSNSIEAARFWRLDAYIKSGGINFSQIAFEETQPTIRYVEIGGIIQRAEFTGVRHDEKHVTLKGLVNKKKYYFSKMSHTLETEESGTLKALQRWYFFRPVLYRKENLVQYMRHPILTLGMIFMYFYLSCICVVELIKKKD